MMNRISAGAAVALAIAVSMPALAGDLVYTPVNPSFGGNALNSSHLLGLANAQRTATARDANDGDSDPTDPTTPGNTDADLFIRQLQGRLLSALASQVTEAIFGENPQDQGTVQFGDTTVEFIRTADSIRLIITDPTGVTEIVVPQLVTTLDTTASALASSLATQSTATSGSLTPTALGTKSLGGDLVFD
jgi:curli production assembly/transport component CsgF